MNYRKFITFLLVLTLMFCVGCSAGENNSQNGENTAVETPAEEQMTGTSVGDRIADFTVTTYDGKTITLSEVLAEKKLVLINIWATWCGPCRMEFPFMEEAYQEYRDSVEILAISGDPSDTDNMIGEVAAELGLSFPMGRDSAGLAERFAVAAFPTTIVVDRFGTICLVEAGAQTSADVFRSLFEGFTGEGYTESILLDGFPAVIPDSERFSDEELSAALNAEGGTLTFRNSANVFLWPMAVTEKDGRTVLTATNGGKASTRCAVELTVDAKAGEVLVFDFAVSSEKGFDCLKLMVNGETVKRFSGERDWMTYAHAFAADGEHRVTFAYAKDNVGDGGADTLWLDNVRVLSGGEAEAALAANPVYPVGNENGIRVANESARKINITDPNGALLNFFGGAYEAYIVFDDVAKFAVTLAEGVDPHGAMAYNNHSEMQIMADVVVGDWYTLSYEVDTMDSTGSAASYVLLIPDPEGREMYPVLFFADEENATEFITNNVGGSWEYDERGGNISVGEENVTYTIRFVDQNGDAVPGVTAQICDDSSCLVAVSDANGVCEMLLPPYAYEIHVLKIPDGYELDSNGVYTAPAAGGELVISLKKN